jgi:hypothetical protein
MAPHLKVMPGYRSESINSSITWMYYLFRVALIGFMPQFAVIWNELANPLGPMTC